MGKTRESANLVSFGNVFSDITNQRIGIGINTPQEVLHVDGNVRCTDLNSTSDISLKKDLQKIPDSLYKILQLNGYEFNWKETNKPSIGVIAQELEKVLPQLVSESVPKSVNYNGIIAVLIESIKELNQKVEALTEEVRSLRMTE
jgi:hypothetical protein